MILHYEIEVDDNTGPQVIGIMMRQFGVMSRFITDNPLTKEIVSDCYSCDVSPSKSVNTRYSHLKIVRTAN